MNKISFLLIILVFFSSVGCQSSKQNILGNNSTHQLMLRNMQSRYFDTANKQQTLQAIAATLQDLGFIIDKASFDLASISATKLDAYDIAGGTRVPTSLRMTIVVTPRGENKMTVRANAQYAALPIGDPLIYQQFFAALEKSLFLTAHTEE